MLIVASFVFIFLLGDNALIALLIVQALALFFSDQLVIGARAVRPTKDQPEVTIVTVLVHARGDKVAVERGNQVSAADKEGA